MFKKLKGELYSNSINQKVLAEHLEKSQTYVTERMTGKKSFSMNDVYKICDLLEIPYEQISVYFPKGGIDVKKENLL